jgi:hypothetical protein
MIELPSDIELVIFSFLETNKHPIHREIRKIRVIHCSIGDESFMGAFRLYKFLKMHIM